jgi:hypothetical protein
VQPVRVELTDIGAFNDSGRLVVQVGGKTVLDLENHFLHEGIPQRHLQAVVKSFGGTTEVVTTNSGWETTKVVTTNGAEGEITNTLGETTEVITTNGAEGVTKNTGGERQGDRIRSACWRARYRSKAG